MHTIRLMRLCCSYSGRYASIGAVLISKRIADGVRDTSGFLKHGHTYQVRTVTQDLRD